jgi:hypothetical protein
MQGDLPCSSDPATFASTEQTQKCRIKLSTTRETSKAAEGYTAPGAFDGMAVRKGGNSQPATGRGGGEEHDRENEPSMAHNVFIFLGLNGAPGEIRTPGLLIRSEHILLKVSPRNKMVIYKPFIYIDIRRRSTDNDG